MKNKKIIIIIAVIAVAALAYYFLIYKKSATISDADASAARTALNALLPNDQRFLGLVNSLSNAQAVALKNWNDAGRPSTWQQDAVLNPVLAAFKAANNYFF